MKEPEYIKLCNRVNITSALNSLREVMAGKEYEVDARKLNRLTRELSEIEQKLRSSVRISE
jgi:hypothetical protein